MQEQDNEPEARGTSIGRFSRRSLFATAAAASGLTALPRTLTAVAGGPAARYGPIPAIAQLTVPWTAYQGAVQDQPDWASFQRGGNFAGAQGRLLVGELTAHLQTHDLLSWAAPHPSSSEFDTLVQFMDSIHLTSGVAWRAATATWVNDLISVHVDTPHKVIGLETENEINNVGYRNNLALWATLAGLPFPHPRSNYGDGAIQNSRDHIGYYVEYVLAPAVEGARWANGTWPDEQRIAIVLGTLVGARHPRLRDVFMPALLDYEIEGLFAPSLVGKRVKEVVDYIALHYLLSPESIWGYTEPGGAPIPYGHNRALDDLHSRWVGNGTIKGIWHTEEGGNAIANVEQLGSSAVRIFGRLTNWALTRGKTPTQTRLVGYYAGGAEHLPDPRWQTSWRYALEVIDQFIGNSPRLFNRSANTLAYADDRLETYGFESGDRMRRILIATPQSATWQGATNIGWLGSKFDGWTSTSIQLEASGHLFKSDAEGYRTFALTATRNGPRGWFDVYLPESIALNANDDRQALLVTLERT